MQKSAPVGGLVLMSLKLALSSVFTRVMTSTDCAQRAIASEASLAAVGCVDLEACIDNTLVAALGVRSNTGRRCGCLQRP